ncbi:Uncharacterised protein [Campylobacter sputorum subsp. bubulus]|uniref:Uncharacterized protein n=1 Tax=Campylobacter sputorum subsp. sputorum TaxID=32024 RepID=A0A381DIC0_9BACT|nr:hypothetical protein CSPUT_1293 [Campylobacter sputorum aubsp. sputorum RM3237]QEL05676.1 putative membrane protein [Campylobacter sputorum subsp. sputorum]SUX08358.1 Uncharacterised protein [Campylobacter sputorum subsp. bubulus]SUX10443.1 Uncharacterised protein [Campylobacter sputorum subsp. sputorum]
MNIFYLSFIFFLFEIIDIYLVKSENFLDIIQEYIKNYTKFPILFLMSKGNFILLCFIIFALNVNNFIMISLFIVYFLDIYMNISIIDKVLNGKNLGIYKDIFIVNPKISKKSRLIISCCTTILFYTGIS